jgi:hypothetical protein
MRRVSLVTLVVLLSSAAVVAACGSSREGAWSQPVAPRAAARQPGASERMTALEQEAEQHWTKRGEEQELRAAIDKWNAVVGVDPSRSETWVRLSHANYLLADGFLSFDEARRAEFNAAHEKGIAAAERALGALSEDFRARMAAGTRIEDAISVLDRSAVPALYWRSSNLGKWASAQGFATVLQYKDEIRAVMQFCVERDEDYFYAGPHRYFGAFYARAPAFAGGDLTKSEFHFKRALDRAPNYFATRVLYATDFAVKSQNRALYEEQLNLVINGNPAADPAVEPENRIEQRKAREALAQADERFE